jgi:short-subunit dehydrogenase
VQCLIAIKSIANNSLINVGNLHERKTQKLFQQKVDGKTIIVTGASSGIGLTVSKYLAQAGAHVLLLARTKEKLDEVKAEIEAEGGKASVFPCDLNDMESIDAVSKEILAAVDHIDILINNAGRSIRRAVHESVDRFHDFERTMQLITSVQYVWY